MSAQGQAILAGGRRSWLRPPPVGSRCLPGLLAVAVFGLYATTTGQLVGYEPETAAVAEGLVKAGAPRVLPGSPLTDQGTRGRGGRLYSRTGLAQPILEAPFYLAGERLDEIASGGRSYRWRAALLRFYNPAMAMLTVVAVFALLRLRGRSRRRALGVSTLCAVGTLIWPYAKIGMEVTLMATVAVALLAGAWAAQRATRARLALAGVAAGAAIEMSPGKGLLFYSPLVLLGVLGLRALWREDRALGLAIVLTCAVNTLIIAATWVWSDDTWGPRYLVPTAWLLVLPVAWWAEGHRRRRVLAWVGAMALLVQSIGVFVPYDAASVATRKLTHVFVYPVGVPSLTASVPYGNDGPRWIPGVSAVLVQAEVLTAWAKQQLTGTGFRLGYHPTWGASGQLDLRDPATTLGTVLPDFWWRFPGQTPALEILATGVALAGAGGGTALAWLARRPRSRSTSA